MLDTLKGSPVVHGIDISGENGTFSIAPFAGEIGFIGIRATSWSAFGLVEDPYFAANWKNAKDAGIPRIAYHAIQPASAVTVYEQADALEHAVSSHGIIPGDLFAVDLEPVYMNEVPPEVGAHFAVTFAHQVNLRFPGHRVVAYTDVDLANRGYCAGLHVHPLWLAEYEVSAPSVPAEWANRGKTWHIWQTTGTGLDRDLFNGTPEDYKYFTQPDLPPRSHQEGAQTGDFTDPDNHTDPTPGGSSDGSTVRVV